MKIVAQRVCSRLYVDLADKCRTVHAYPNSRLTRRLGRKTRNARSNGLFQLTARIFKPHSQPPQHQQFQDQAFPVSADRHTASPASPDARGRYPAQRGALHL